MGQKSFKQWEKTFDKLSETEVRNLLYSLIFDGDNPLWKIKKNKFEEREVSGADFIDHFTTLLDAYGICPQETYERVKDDEEKSSG